MTPKNLHFRFFVWLGILLVIGLARTPIVFAQISNSTCRGVDLIVLVDQSDSMKYNDPENLRTFAIRLMVESLGNDILYDCPGITHRFSVIGFGAASPSSLATVEISNTEIAPTLVQFSQWKANREKIKNEIPESFSTIPNGTDYLAAFQAAKGQLDRWSAAKPADQDRLRSVILIADGGACINIANGTCFAAGGSQSQYLANLETFLDPQGVNFPWRGNTNAQSVFIWFIGLNDIKNPQRFYLADPAVSSVWDRIISEHGGSILALDSGLDANDLNRDISRGIANIADQITGSDTKPTTCKEPFYVQPYLERVIIRILKIGSDPSVELEDVKVAVVYDGPKEEVKLEGGQVTENKMRIADYIADGPNELYVIASPPPGSYHIEVTGADECRDLDVGYQEFPLRGEIIEPHSAAVLPQFDESPYYDRNEEYHMEFSVVGGGDTENQIVRIISDPDFPLSLTTVVTNSEGVRQTFNLQEQDSGNWRSVDPIEVPVAGLYAWQLIGTAPDPETKSSVKRFSDHGTFTVKPVSRFRLAILEPTPNALLPLNGFERGNPVFSPIELIAQFQNVVDGTPLTQAEIAVSRLFSPLSAEVSVGSQTSISIPMVYDSSRQAWTVVLTPGEQGVPVNVGQQQIRVSLDQTRYNKEDYRPDAIGGTESVVAVIRTLVLNKGAASPTIDSTPVPQYDVEPFYDPNNPVFFTYQIAGYGQEGSTLSDSFSPEQLTVTLEVSLNGQRIQDTELTYNNGDEWQSATPLLIKDDGTYDWRLSIKPSDPANASVVPSMSDQGQFVVSRVGRYRVELLRPTVGEYALNRIENGKSEDIPLLVEVALVDEETGDNLTPQNLLADAVSSSIISVTIQGPTKSTGPVPLVYDTVARTWRAGLNTAKGEAPDEEGQQTMRLSFTANAVDAEQYRPSLNQPDMKVKFERVLVQPIALQVTQSEISTQIYSGNAGCFNAKLIPLAVQVRLVETDGEGSVLDPKQVAAGDLESLISAQLFDPGSQEPLEDGRIEVVDIGGTQVLRVVVGLTHTEAGRYQIRIVPNPDVIRAGYQFLTGTTPTIVNVERTLGLWYAPSTCTTIKTGLLLFLVLLLGYMAWCWIGRPIGLLDFVDDSGMSISGEYRLGRSIRNLFWRSQVIKLPSTWGLSKIVVSRASSEAIPVMSFDDFDQTGEIASKSSIRAIRIRILGTDGAELNEITVTSGSPPYPVAEDISIEYT